MADMTKLKDLIEAYGTAVRAGLVTPCKSDEEYFRDQLGIPKMSQEVSADWAGSKGVRRPITLQRPSETDDNKNESVAAQQAAEGEI